MPAAKKPRYVDVSNTALAVECPRCGLLTARFVDHCRNCGYKIWPSSEMASAAFKAWLEGQRTLLGTLITDANIKLG